ncbi:TRAP transporter substrate-binding protein [Halomonas sp. TRM85114]|uniref:TRAP transporter substrate-binding protein n=1 Tax=Halomonas jincaotanensis TaxID=2810616 RepID=UPI001BD500AD|nr:TRAP transporter substrate-binding protein [Halomonas jincaotanensis]MBS9402364.1 TRAP transporter substrate-binding protein [Halomonas jincaotanensis]
MKKALVKTAISGSCILGLTLASAGSAVAQTYSATFAYFDSNVDFQLPAAEAFKNYIEVATDGDMEINITTVGGLGGDEREVLDQLRLGELQFMTPNAGGLAGAFPAAQVWNLPFLFAGRHIAWKVFQDREYIGLVNDQIQTDTNGQLRFLGAAENSVRHLYTTRGPIRVPSDLDSEGIKIRTMQAPMHQAVWTELGAPSVVALPAAERYTGLQTGLIDATEGGLNSAWNAGLLEVADYVTLTAHMYDVTSYIVSDNFFESLPEEYQKVVEEASSLAIDVQNAHALVKDNEALNRIIEAGNTVVEPTSEERAAWRELAEPVGREFVAEVADPDFMQATLDTVSRVEETFYQQQ